MKTLLFILISCFFTVANADDSNCRLVDDSFADISNSYSNNLKKSSGWIVCDDISTTSIVINKVIDSKIDIIKKITKKSLPDQGNLKTSKTKLSFAERHVAISDVSVGQAFHVFYFIKINNKDYVLSSMLIDSSKADKIISEIDLVIERFSKSPKSFPRF